MEAMSEAMGAAADKALPASGIYKAEGDPWTYVVSPDGTITTFAEDGVVKRPSGSQRDAILAQISEGVLGLQQTTPTPEAPAEDTPREPIPARDGITQLAEDGDIGTIEDKMAPGTDASGNPQSDMDPNAVTPDMLAQAKEEAAGLEKRSLKKSEAQLEGEDAGASLGELAGKAAENPKDEAPAEDEVDEEDDGTMGGFLGKIAGKALRKKSKES